LKGKRLWRENFAKGESRIYSVSVIFSLWEFDVDRGAGT